jgi:hypothetical protein
MEFLAQARHHFALFCGNFALRLRHFLPRSTATSFSF